MEKSKGKTNDYNKTQVQEYPKDYYQGDVYNPEGGEEFAMAVKDLDQTKLSKFNKKLVTELEKGESPVFKLKK